MKKLLLIALVLPALLLPNVRAAVTTRVVKDSLFIPWEILWGPDDAIWLTQKNGYICRLHPGTGVLDTLYHEAATVIQSEGGMLGMALHPQFAANPYVYVVYDYLRGSAYRERLVRYTYNGSNALGSPLILLDSVNAAVNHNGSRIAIVGDKLFFTTGDATVMSNAQNLSSLNGKIHRINLDGSIPADNPLPGSSIWSWGHRNPQGLVYANGLLYSSEHGNTTDDEVNIIHKGRNYGWPTVEGFCDKPGELQFCADSNVAQPLTVWTPTIAPSGIDYYDGAMFPQWKGSLLMASLKDAHLYQLMLNAAKDSIVSKSVVQGIAFGRLRDVCISPSGRVYLSTSNSTASGAGAKIDRIVEVYDPANTGAGTPKSVEVSIMPNPARGTISVKLPWSAGRYRIVDALGRTVLSGAVDAPRQSIDISQLVSGVYNINCLPAGNGEVIKAVFTKVE